MRLATLKHINSKNADYGAAEQYLLFEHDEFTMKPVLDETGRLIPREDYRLSTLNCGGEDFAVEMCIRDRSYDELELDKLGDEKSALFFLISDTDTTYNFLVALAFSQMFNLLCERADNTYGGRLPYHVRVLWDEAANTGQVPGLEKIVAVIRSREISLTLFYQAMSQCKACLLYTSRCV